MQYTCCLMIETFMRTSTRSNASGAHWAMIERCRRTLTALWVPFFSLSSSHSPRESSSLPFIWFSWVGAPCLVYPSPIPSSFSFLRPSFPTPSLYPLPLTLLLSGPSRTSQGSVPCLSSSRSPSTSLFINCQTDPTHIYTHTNRYINTHTNTLNDL